MRKLRKTFWMVSAVMITLSAYGFVGWYLWQSTKLWP